MLINEYLLGTVKRAIEIDTREVIQENKIKVTSSAIDITICFEQCYQFHHQLSWSHAEDGALIIGRLCFPSMCTNRKGLFSPEIRPNKFARKKPSI